MNKYIGWQECGKDWYKRTQFSSSIKELKSKTEKPKNSSIILLFRKRGGGGQKKQRRELKAVCFRK